MVADATGVDHAKASRAMARWGRRMHGATDLVYHGGGLVVHCSRCKVG